MLLSHHTSKANYIIQQLSNQMEHNIYIYNTVQVNEHQEKEGEGEGEN